MAEKMFWMHLGTHALSLTCVLNPLTQKETLNCFSQFFIHFACLSLEIPGLQLQVNHPPMSVGIA